MSYESIRLKRAEEFLEQRKLGADFENFLTVREAQIAADKNPAVMISRTEHHGRRNRNIPMYVNITPWLRTATTAQIERLMEIDSFSLPLAEDRQTNDVDFLDEIWNFCLDEPWNEEDYHGYWEREYHCAVDLDLDELGFALKEVNPPAYRDLFATLEELGQLRFPMPELEVVYPLF